MENPLISVIIPVYNRESTIIEAVKSVLNQDYEPLELIIVDDASSDNTIKILEQISDLRLKVHQHKTNRGANAARNTGINNSTGEWIAFLDSDDSWNQSKLQKMMNLLLNQENNFQVAYCGINQIKNNQIINSTSVSKSGTLSDDLLYKNIVGSFSVPLIHRNVLTTVSWLDESLKSAQDWDLWLRISQKGYLFKAINECLVDYQLPDSDDQISSNLGSFLDGREAFLDKHKHHYESNSNALSTVYRDMAFLLLHRFNNHRIARSYFLRSLKNNAFQSKAYKGLVATFFPSALNKRFE